MEGSDNMTIGRRPRKMRKTHAIEDDPVGSEARSSEVVWHAAAVAEAEEEQADGTGLSHGLVRPAGHSPTGGDGSAAEVRSCENCRRCKQKCSRSYPCEKCVLKGIQCVYEQQPDKRRGPRPGYIEELYRRIDMLEHMLLGQSLIQSTDGKTKAAAVNFQEAVENGRARLTELGHMHRQRQQQQQHEQLELYQQQQHTPDSCTTSRGNQDVEGQSRSCAHEHDLPPSMDTLRQMCEIYRHQFQPWIPILRQAMLESKVSMSDQADLCDPVLQAVAAISSPFISAMAGDNRRYITWLTEFIPQKILQSASVEHFQCAVILLFYLFGRGTITEYWGVATYLPQLALRAGLHLEDQHLSAEYREYRNLIRFDATDQTWAGKEAVRRLFWTIFLQDQFAAIFSGTQATFQAATIRRLLPCDGQKWHDDQPVYTREFVPSNVAVRVPVFQDGNVGGFAYLIEATEILTIISAFALRMERTRMPRDDPRGFLQEFLHLDLILTNWKSKLPSRYQHASYDENGYMDHNITLAHMTHNTSGILLYQTLRGQSVLGLDGPAQPALFPQITVIKQAAKETAKICTRFLLHRRYLVSPQFSYCQFLAARALLAYSDWLMEPLDEDFETLYTSLGESAKRWDGILKANHEVNLDPASLDNFTSRLYARVTADAKRVHAIDLATPCVVLLKAADGQGTQAPGFATTSVDQLQGRGQGESGEIGDRPAMNGLTSPTNGVVAAAAALDLPEFLGRMEGYDGAMALLNPAEPESIENRIFSWQDCEELAPPPTEPRLEVH